MRRRSSTLPLWLRIVVLPALLAAVVACDDPIPAAPNVSESETIIINPDALRLLALLSQLEIELGIIDGLINSRPYHYPKPWPLDPEDGAALDFASSRLSRLELQLSDYVLSLAKPPPTFDDDQILPALVELQTELSQIGRSIYALWDAHDDGEATAPEARPVRDAKAQIARLADSVAAFLATDRAGAPLIPGVVWRIANAHERLSWAARSNCFSWNCHGSDYYGPPEFRERTITVYSVAEFHSRPAVWAYPESEIDDAYCRRSVADARSAFWAVSSTWSEHAHRFREADFDERADGWPPPLDSMLSASSLYRRMLLTCALSTAASSALSSPSALSESDALFVKAEALHLLALLGQLEVELDILDAIIEPRADSRPGQWPPARENAAALGFTSERLFWVNSQLSDFIRTLTEPPPVFVDETILTPLTELEAEMRLIRSSTYDLWQAHETGEPLVAPATRLTTIARTRIDRLIEALSGFLASLP